MIPILHDNMTFLRIALEYLLFAQIEGEVNPLLQEKPEMPQC